jgi:acyl dehydratase
MGRNDEVYVGRYYGERSLDITPELAQAYTVAVEDHNPWYYGDSPFGGSVAPALLLHSEVYRDVAWYLSIFGNLHARQEWELFHPMSPGDQVTARRQIVNRYSKRDRDYVVNEVSVFAPDGTLLNRGRTHQSFLAKAVDSSETVVDKNREKRGDRKFEMEDGEVIEELGGPSKFVSVDMCKRFSPGKSYHNDAEEARKLGFPDIVVQGMMSLCFLSEMLTNRFGEGWYQGGRMDVNLVNVLWQGETVKAKGLVRAKTREGAATRSEVDVWCEKEDGTKIVVGKASGLEFGMKRPGVTPGLRWLNVEGYSGCFGR